MREDHDSWGLLGPSSKKQTRQRARDGAPLHTITNSVTQDYSATGCVVHMSKSLREVDRRDARGARTVPSSSHANA